jgi:hypothetical protein
MGTEVQKQGGHEPNGAMTNGLGAAVAHAIPLRRRKVRVEVEIPEGQMGEFDLMMHGLLAGKRKRLDTLEQEWKAIEARALAGLAVIVAAIQAHPGTGQAGRLVQFLAAVYNGYAYPFDLSDLRTLDTKLANACLD